ncbi:hypothetical protein BD410DRAFT_846528 [Rickenella mellea]|uniref:Uncharacterized protein n=1 Tax=Rickenella mellea TaxID=50990 RepID=A0A4Y7PFS7_9AGAM|nr:hypothetical protein BD410DRAFT_846528 [Rickenella mellea]
MSIDPGVYTIRNVMHRNFAAQSSEGTVVAYADRITSSVGLYDPYGDDEPDYWWSISRLDNDKYSIRNIETKDYAASPNFPAIEEDIITARNLHQWDVKETAIKGKYVIYTNRAKTDLFWGLTDGQLLTPISLRNKPNTQAANLQNVATILLGKNRMLQDENTKLQDEHTKLQDEHTKLQDEHTKLRDGAERLNEDVRQERARHLQAEAELKAHYEKLLAEEGFLEQYCDIYGKND